MTIWGVTSQFVKILFRNKGQLEHNTNKTNQARKNAKREHTNANRTQNSRGKQSRLRLTCTKMPWLVMQLTNFRMGIWEIEKVFGAHAFSRDFTWRAVQNNWLRNRRKLTTIYRYLQSTIRRWRQVFRYRVYSLAIRSIKGHFENYIFF